MFRYAAGCDSVKTKTHRDELDRDSIIHLENPELDLKVAQHGDIFLRRKRKHE